MRTRKGAGFFRPQSYGKYLRSLLGSADGSTLPMVAFLLIPLVGFVGIATDVARGYMIKARLGDALDAATLAGAQVVTTSPNFQSDIQMYFDANFPPGFMGSTVTLDPPRVSADQRVISLSARADIGTTFMSLFGFEDMTIASSSQVTRDITSMDVVLSMDMSGSMGNSDGAGSTRIAAARDAAHILADTIFAQDPAGDLVQMAVLPWNGKVNVTEDGTSFAGNGRLVSVANFTSPVTGALQGDVFLPVNSPVSLFSEPPPNWRGCVYARYKRNGRPDDADDLLGPLTVGGVDWVAWEPVGHEGEPMSAGGTCRNSDCSACLSHGVTRLTNDELAVSDAIDRLTRPEGTTNIAQGLIWAGRIVSPGEPFDDANPFPRGQHQRAIVLLTDGQQWGRQGDGYKGAFGNGANAGPNGMNARLREIADKLKAQGIQIFAVQFYHSSGSLASLMKAVATEPKEPYYFFAPDGAALEKAFEEIANQLSVLRISK